MPAPAAPVFAGTTRLKGALDLQDGAVETQGVELASASATLLVTGSLSKEHMLDVTGTARALPTASALTRAERSRSRRSSSTVRRAGRFRRRA